MKIEVVEKKIKRETLNSEIKNRKFSIQEIVIWKERKKTFFNLDLDKHFICTTSNSGNQQQQRKKKNLHKFKLNWKWKCKTLGNSKCEINSQESENYFLKLKMTRTYQLRWNKLPANKTALSNA